MKTWTMALFTLKETVRTKTMIAGLVVSFLYLAVTPVLSSTSGGGAIVGEMDKAAASIDFLNFALTGLNFIGIFLAIFTTLGTVYSEVEQGTILTVVTKPLERRQIIYGKWLGHSLTMIIYVLLMGVMLWIPAAVDAGAVWSYFPALGLVCLNVATMVSLTMLFSVFVPVIANAIFVFIIFILTANLSVVDIINRMSDNLIVSIVAAGLRLVLPVSEVTDLAGSLMRTRAAEAAMASNSVLVPRAWSFAYEIVYMGVLVVLSARIFRKRDLV